MQGKGKAIILVVVFALLLLGVWYMWHEPAPDTTLPPAPAGGAETAPGPNGRPAPAPAAEPDAPANRGPRMSG